MSKHTPGPWKAGTKSVTAPETEDRLAMDVRLYGGNSDDHRANARLIAAAPDLLAALNAMLTHMGMDEDEWNRPTFEQARKAVDKAVFVRPNV